MFLKGDYVGMLEFSRLTKPNGEDFQAFAALEIRTPAGDGKLSRRRSSGAMILWRRAPFDPELALAVSAALRADGQSAEAQAVMQRALQVEPAPPAAGDSRDTVAYGELLLAAGHGCEGRCWTVICNPRKRRIPQAARRIWRSADSRWRTTTASWRRRTSARD